VLEFSLEYQLLSFFDLRTAIPFYDDDAVFHPDILLFCSRLVVLPRRW